jgi:hypothetical protein
LSNIGYERGSILIIEKRFQYYFEAEPIATVADSSIKARKVAPDISSTSSSKRSFVSGQKQFSLWVKTDFINKKSN